MATQKLTAFELQLKTIGVVHGLWGLCVINARKLFTGNCCRIGGGRIRPEARSRGDCRTLTFKP